MGSGTVCRFIIIVIICVFFLGGGLLEGLRAFSSNSRSMLQSVLFLWISSMCEPK